MAHRDVSMQDSANETSYETTYGNFDVNKSSPYFVALLSGGPGSEDVAESAFLVLYQGLDLLSPGNGTVDNNTPGELTFHYGVYLSAALMGTMKVDYRFERETNNISISFSPSVGLPSQFQIVWLTFTVWDAVDTGYPSDIEQRFEDLDGRFGQLFLGLDVGTLYGIGTIEMPGAIIRPYKIAGSPGGPDLLLDASDAASDFNATYAGKLNFTGRFGNAVMSTFLPGHLDIDPTYIASTPSTATAYSVQRKTFYDGQRYWLFWQSNPTTISYSSSIDGMNWNSGRTVTTIGSLPLGLTAVNFGTTVAVVWVDGSSNTQLKIDTGLIAEDTILWDGARPLYTASGAITRAPTAAFGSASSLGFTWSDAGIGAAAFQRYTCTGPGTGFSYCATGTLSQLDFYDNMQSSVAVVPYATDAYIVAEFNWRTSPPPGDVTVWVHVDNPDGSHCVSPYSVVIGLPGPASSWIASGLFTVVPLNNAMRVFYWDGASHINYFDAFGSCGYTSPANVVPVTSPTYLTATTEQDQSAVDLFWQDGSDSHMHYAKMTGAAVPINGLVPTMSSYVPTYTTSASVAGHFIPLAFTTGTGTNCASGSCLFYVGYPLPLDSEVAVNNPWATKLGAPFTTDTGGVVSPNTGLVSLGQVLVSGSPSISINYREPGLFYQSGGADAKFTSNTEGFQIIPGMYLDIPWIGTDFEVPSGQQFGMMHMQGGQKFPLAITGTDSPLWDSWYNNTNGVRYTLKYDHNSAKYILTLPSGTYLYLDANGRLSEIHLAPATSSNYLTLAGLATSGASGSIADSSTPSRTISISAGATTITYGNGQSVSLAKTVGGWSIPGFYDCSTGTSTDSGKLQVMDPISRVTTYWVCRWKLMRLESPNGGRVDYAYATYGATPGPGNQIWQGTEVYSLPLLRMDSYNESGANIKARSTAFNWNFQNGEVVRALVNTTDKSAVVQGSNEYIFNSAAGAASVRVYDSAGQVLYYDMETLNGTKMKDLSGHVSDGTVTGTTIVLGKYGMARYFNGVGDRIGVTSPASLPLGSSARTLSAWVYIVDYPTSNAAFVVAYGANGPATGYAFGLGIDIFGNVISDIYGARASSTLLVYSNEWHFIAATYSGGSSVTLTLDGISQSKSYGATPNTQSGELDVGTWFNGACCSFLGYVDEVRVYNRALSTEDVGILYTKNALKRGEQQNWYSVNDQPHLAEGFVGDETAASVVSQDATDDWGNQIYHRDALGNETFASYANTNHQNHFYAPGRLTKTGTSNTEFVDFSDGRFPTGQGTWTVSGGGTARIDYGTLDKLTPALNLTGSTQVYHSLTVGAGSRFIEFRAKVSAVQEFDIRFGTVTTDYLKVRFGTSGYIEYWVAGAWTACGYYGAGAKQYTTNAWYRFTFAIDMTTSPYAWSAYVNGIDVTGPGMTCANSTLGAGASLTQLTLQLFGNTGWVDDIKVYNNNNGQSGFNALNIGFAGLQPRQSIRLLAEDGSIIDQTIQTVAGTTLWLSFNSALTGAYKYAENGDNAKSVVQIYAEDGTLEYQSPLTRFFVGEQYTYTRPRTFADELVKTRSGSLYWPNPAQVYADDSCAGITCLNDGSWVWKQSPDVRAMFGTKVHFTAFDYGYREHGFTMTATSMPIFGFIIYVLIPQNKAPDGISLGFIRSGNFYYVYWGVNKPGTSGVYMGPVPVSRDQWVMLTVKSSDISGTGTWGGLYYGASGGEVQWDATTTINNDLLTVSGLTGLGSNIKVSLYDSVNNQVIASGSESAGSASIDVYKPPFATSWDAFPVQVNIKICSSTNSGCFGDSYETTEYYFGPLRSVWPGDTFRYIGASSFFNSKSTGDTYTYWPSSSIHTALVGSKKFSGDCLDSIACYDMETVSEGATAADTTGTVTVSMKDLSGRDKGGTLTGAPKFSTIDKGGAGLATTFDGVADKIQSSPSVSGLTTWSISAWVNYDSSGASANQNPIALGATQDATIYIVKSNNKIYMKTLNNAAGTVVDANMGTITPGISTHLVITFGGTYVSGFINGVVVKTAFGPTSYIRTNNMMLGATGASGNFFKGSVDQVIVYSYQLSAQQVLALYQSRMPGAPQVYIRPLQTGLANATRTPYEGIYLYATAQYDNKGNVVSVTDVGRSVNGGKNVTQYAYSTVDGRDYRTQVNRSDGKQIYTAYDFQSGIKYGTLDIDCRRSRTQYDAIGRPTQTSVYDTDSSEILHLDMETATYNSLKDVSCAGTQDSTQGQGITMSGTTAIAGIEGGARVFDGVSNNLLTTTNVLSGVTSSVTISVWVAGVTSSSKGAFVKVSASSSTNEGYGVGVGSATWDAAGNHLIGLYEGVRWIDTGTSIGMGWHHIVMVIDASGIPSFYLDGRSLGAFGTTGPFAPSNPTAIGGYTAAGSHARFFAGTIDEVRIFKSALSAPTVADFWNFKYKLLTSFAVAYDDKFPTSVTSYDGGSTPRSVFYDLETCIVMPCASGGSIEDLSGHGNDATIVGTLSTVTGKIGNAKSSTGIGNYADLYVPNSLSSSSITVSAWVKIGTGVNWQNIVNHDWLNAAGTWVVYTGASNQLSWAITPDGVTQDGLSSSAVTTGVWHHVVGTYDGVTMALYIDGALCGGCSSTAYGGIRLATIGFITSMDQSASGGTISVDEVHIIPRALSASEVSDLYNGIEKSHMSKTYQDGLGRTTRSVVMDMFGTRLTTFATLGWNDQPVYSYLPSGQYSTFTYDFLGRTLSVQSPGDSTLSGISRTIVSEKARMIELVDAVGRKVYQKTDLLGRTIETAVWNPQTSAYGNLTSASYNALSEVTVSKDAKGQTTTIYYNSLGKPKMTVFPDVTNSTGYYDDNLRPLETVDVMGRIAVSAYDNIGRVTSVTLKPSLGTDCAGAPNPCVAKYNYDPVHGDLLSIDNVTANVTRTYDSLHRMITETLRVPSSNPTFTGTVTYTYDNASKVIGITYPISGNPYAYYIYDSLGRPREVGYWASGAGQGQGVFSYDTFGRLDNIHYWKGSNDTGLQEKYTYDTRDRVTQVKVFDIGSTYLQLDYVFNKASEIRWSTDNMYVLDGGGVGSNPKNVTYAYNGNGRLTYASGPWGVSQATETHAYTYDQVGNLLTWKLGAATYNYNDGISYPVWNKLNSFSYNGMSFTYNAAGSMLTKVESGATTTYTHDFLQQLVKVASSPNTYGYSYDALGRRVTNVTNSGPTSDFMYSEGEMLYSKVAGIETAFIYVGGKMLMSRAGLTGDTWYYHQDLSGNIRLINYYSSSIVVTTYAKYRYRPFGDLITLSGGGQKFQFANQELDSAARLYHMGARYHDPLVGRFIERDPIGSGYDYAYNNPVSFGDPSGMSPFDGVSGLIGGAKNWLEDQWGHNPTFRAAVGLAVTVLMAVLIPVGGELIDMLLVGALVGTIFWANTMIASHGTASGADQIAAFSDGFAVGTILYNVAAGFRLIGRAGQMAAAKAGVSAAEKPSLSGAEKAGLSEAAKELDFPEGAAKFFQRADRVEAFLSDEGQANHAYSRFLERSPDEAQRLGLTGGWKADRQLWKEMNTRLIEESDESVLFRMSGTGVSGKGGPILAEGFVGEQNGVRLIAIFDWNSGAFVTAAVPLRFQEELYASRLLSLVLGG